MVGQERAPVRLGSSAHTLGALQRVQAWSCVLGLCGRCALVPVPGRGSLCRQACGHVCVGVRNSVGCPVHGGVFVWVPLASLNVRAVHSRGLVCVCGCAGVCLCSVPGSVDTAVGLCVRTCACIAPSTPQFRLCGHVGSVWVHCVGVCLECVPWDAALLAKGLSGLSARTGSHSVSPQSSSPFLPLGGGKG